MAKDKRKTVFNVAVIGLSGSEQVKGTSGVGKSCLCNRFVREEADSYFPDHTSVLSQSDFGGRIVNNDHFLYWGEVIKKDDVGELKFHVIEQTEFIDDQSYRPHRSSSNQNYFKRCCQTKVSSAEKLMYICTDQLGLESDFDNKVMPEGKLHIDGFIVCYDVSLDSNRVIDDQVSFVQSCLTNLTKTKKPIVLALTKCDELKTKAVDAATKLAATSGSKKGGAIHVIETSASENINVTSAFMILAQIIDKARAKSKIIQFHAAAEERKKILEGAKVELQQLMKRYVEDYHDSWQKSRKNIEDKEAYIRFVYLEGKNAASNIFRKHVNALRDEFRSELQSKYLHFLPLALSKTLPDVSSLRSTWTETLHVICKSEHFDNWFIMLNKPTNGGEWYEHEHMALMEDRRIPYNLLPTTEGERCFLSHRKDLVEKQRKEELKSRFKHLLASNSQVVPGGEWIDMKKCFSKNEVIMELPESDLMSIYNQYQTEIKERARDDFIELLHEKSEVFAQSLPDSELTKRLEGDERYQAMHLLAHDRELLISQHAAEINDPAADNWGAMCLVNVLKKLQIKDSTRNGSKASLSSSNFSLNSSSGKASSTCDLSPWRLKPDSNEFNVVLLGCDELVNQLHGQIKTLLNDGQFTMEDRAYDVNMRVVYGNVCLNNCFQTPSFLPNACIAVFSSERSLSYITSSLENTVLSKTASPPKFYGLPVIIVLAKCSMLEQSNLKEEGQKLAARVGCPFLDASATDKQAAVMSNKMFATSQLKEAIQSFLSKSEYSFAREESSLLDNDVIMDGSGNNSCCPPDLRIIMCTKKDDLATVEVALSPLLNHSSYNPNSSTSKADNNNDLDDLEKEPSDTTVEIETHLMTQRRRIEITLSSYQNARVLMNKEQPIHGFILVYNTLKRSSFEVMKVFAEHSAKSVPKLLLCVSPSDDGNQSNPIFQDNHARQLTWDGNELAGKIKAKFSCAFARHKKDTEFYRTFFTDTWASKTNTEAALSETRTIKELEKDEEEDSVDGEGLVMKQQQQPPIPPPRPSKLAIKANSCDNLVAGKVYKDIDASPQMTRKSVDNKPNMIQQVLHETSFADSNCSRTTPSPSFVSGGESDTYHSTPRASPTACLLEHEVDPSGRHSPPIINDEKRSKSGAGKSSGGNNDKTRPPGKLDPNLLNFAKNNFKPHASGFSSNSNTPTEVGASFLTSTKSLSRFGGQRVLPPPTKTKPSGIATVGGNEASNSNTRADIDFPENRPRNGGGASMYSGVRPSNKVSSPITSRPPMLQPSQSCTSVNDDLVTRPSTQFHKKFYASSQDDLHRPTAFQALIPRGVGDFNGRTIKEEKHRSHHHKKEEDKKLNKKKDAKMRKMKNSSRPNLITPLQTASNNLNASGYFNLELEQIVQGLNHMVPEFVEKCSTYVEKNGLKSEGIYRKSPNNKEREVFLQRYDEDNGVQFDSIPKITEHMVAANLKWFFSDKHLRVPLIPDVLHQEIASCITPGMGCVPDLSEQIRVLSDTYRKLPYVNYSTLKFLCAHLYSVSQNEDVNKMNAKNLAVCWWPTLFHPSGEAMQLSQTRDALQLTIVHYRSIFIAGQTYQV